MLQRLTKLKNNMARSGINKVILVGNLGQDPEVKYTAGGAAVTTLSLATSDSWKDKETGSNQERTEWHRVVLWRRLAEIAGEYLKKGSKIYIEGQLQTRKWEQDGQTRYTTEIVARDMQFLDSKGSSNSSYEDVNQDISTEVENAGTAIPPQSTRRQTPQPIAQAACQPTRRRPP